MSSQKHNAYYHSGGLGSAAILAPAAGFISAFVLSIVYAYATVNLSIGGYISVLFILILGFGVGFAISVTGSIAKCRNPMFLHVVGFLSGLVTLYFAWAMFIYVLIQHKGAVNVSMVDLICSPVQIWKDMLVINKTGWFTIANFTPKGTVLWIFWAIEAVIIVCLPAFFAVFAIHSEVFCEDCGQWCESEKKPLRLGLKDVVDNDQRLVNIFNADLNELESLPRVKKKENPHLEVEIKKCGSCAQTAAMLFFLVYYNKDKDENGKLLDKKLALTPHILIDGNQLQRIEEMRNKPFVVEQEQPEDDSPLDLSCLEKIFSYM